MSNTNNKRIKKYNNNNNNNNLNSAKLGILNNLIKERRNNLNNIIYIKRIKRKITFRVMILFREIQLKSLRIMKKKRANKAVG